MAPEMIFPIKFDLDSAVSTADREWETKYAAQLEKALAKRKVKVSLALDTKGLDNLDDIQRRLKALKIEPLTPENRRAIQELTRELKQLARIMEKLSGFKGITTPGLAAAKEAKIRKETLQLDEKLALQKERVRQAEERLILAQQRAATQATATGRAFRTQSTYLERLAKRLIAIWSIRQVGTFLTNVRQVTAEFELQRVSLGAIIQDQNRANALFSEIKSFALKSPVSILDLTKYTKQLAAYKIGVDELFETTKKLTDVSVGLGVSMDRVVLAYGQTRATGYLRASEIRQFTEMGVPIVEELAKKLSAMNGELVTAAQVMDMVSKRAISFEMVKDVFDDMTSAGGIFYQMQEKQGNTLFGLWAKLGDAASVMYDQIGNTERVNAGIKGSIELLTELMRNWKTAASTMATMGGLYGVMMVGKKADRRGAAIQEAYIAKERQAKAALMVADTRLKAAENELAAAKAGLIRKTEAEAQATRDAAAATQAKAQADYESAAAANANAQSQKKLALGLKSIGLSLLKGLGIGLVISLATTLIYKLFEAYENAHRLKNALAEIDANSAIEQSKAVNNFESLADMAVRAADGSKQQQDALDELHRTYGNMIPVQDMTIEKLRALNGEYKSLTAAIKEYIAQQKLQEKKSTIYEEYGKGVEKAKRALSDYLQTLTVDGKSIGANQAARIVENLRKGIEEDGKSIKDAIRDAFSVEGIRANVDFFSKASNDMGNYAKQLVLMTRAIKAADDETKDSLGSLGRYADAWDATAKAMANFSSTTDKNTFLYSREKLNSDVGFLTSYIKGLFEKENLNWDETAFGNFVESVGKNGETVSVLFWDKINAAAENGSAELKNALQKAQDAYNSAVPSDKVVNLVNKKIIEFTTAAGANMDKMRRYWLADGADISEVAKNLKSDLQDLIDKQKQWKAVNADAAGHFVGNGFSKEEMEGLSNEIKAVQMLLDFLQQLVSMKGSGSGRTSDPRLGILQEMASSLKSINKEYDDLAKKQGADKAFANTFRTYQDTFKRMSELSKKYKFGLPDFDVPTNANELKRYLDTIRQAMAKLPKSDKAVLDLQVDIDKIDIDDLQQKLDKQLKDLSDRISRTKTAREFYDKILSQTGDVEMAGTLTMNVYGDMGADLFNQTVAQIEKYFSGIEVSLPIDFDTQQIDYKALRKIWEADKALPSEMRKIPEAYDSAIKRMLDSADSTNQKMIEGWLKATEKAKTYGDKLADVYRKTATEIERIQNAMAIGDIDRKIGSDLIAGYKRKEAEEIAKLQYEAFKDSPMYVQMFDDLDHASTRMLENMRSRLIAMQGEWKNLDPTQLKELQSRLKEIDTQLVRRNPFKALADGMRDYYNLRTKGDKRGNKSRRAADEDVLRWTEAYAKAEEELAKVMADKGATQAQVAGAKQMVDYTKRQKEEAEKVAENWKKVEDKIGLSANEIFQMLNWAGDIARAVADISEALGADEEDVEYWNTVADSLSNIAGGIQDIVNAAMSGNVVGVVSSVLTAIPKMFVGFSNLFSAGRIRRANKEIRRQQELIDQLEYSYGRLENAIEDAFGTAYLQLYRRQLANLQAQQNAYLKQAEAERSKGKKADKDKIKDYENSARDAEDAIADMQGTLAEKFLGSDLASTARDFAQAWLDAYKEFGNTADAMSEKFHEMIQNMIVESLLGSVMEKALKPAFDMIDNMSDTDFMNQDFWKSLTDTAAKAAQNADAGAYSMMAYLEQAGITMRDLGSDLTGISRDVATASEESINGLAAGINTQNFYISQQLAEVRLIREAVVNRGDSGVIYTDLMAMQNEHLSHLPVIAANTAATVERCERAAVACEDMATQLKRVIRPKQEGTPNYVLNAKVLR